MQPVETVLRARRVVTPDGTAARWVGVHGERLPLTAARGPTPLRAPFRAPQHPQPVPDHERRAERIEAGRAGRWDQGTGKPNR